MVYQRGSVQSYKMWADLVGDESYEFENLLPYFEKSLKFTPPDVNRRFKNGTFFLCNILSISSISIGL